jgi:hypothetical protein
MPWPLAVIYSENETAQIQPVLTVILMIVLDSNI